MGKQKTEAEPSKGEIDVDENMDDPVPSLPNGFGVTQEELLEILEVRHLILHLFEVRTLINGGNTILLFVINIPSPEYGTRMTKRSFGCGCACHSSPTKLSGSMQWVGPKGY